MSMQSPATAPYNFARVAQHWAQERKAWRAEQRKKEPQ